MIRSIRNAGIITAITLVLALALECGVRAWSTAVADWREDDEEGFVFSAELGWKLDPGSTTSPMFGSRKVDRSGVLAIDAAQLGSDRKVLVIADSTGFAAEVPPNKTYAQVLEQSLPNTAVINLSVPGYSSEQAKRVAREQIPRLRPRVVVVSTNFNDRRLSWEPDGSARFERLHRGHRARRFHSHVVEGIINAIPSMGSARDPATVDLATAGVRVEPDAYRRNLTEIAQLGRSTGARVIFLLLSDNPDSGEWLRRGQVALEAGRFDDAIVDFKRSRGAEAYRKFAQRLLGETYRRAGRLAEAKSVARAPLNPSAHGDWVLRFDFQYAEVMREVAAAEGAILVDGSQVLNRDTSVFLDGCHFDEVGHARIAAALREPVAEALK